MQSAGTSTCPICAKTWTVTPLEDCMMPACGCYGYDFSAENPDRPCYPCGSQHAWEHLHDVKEPPKTVLAVLLGGKVSYVSPN